jgi:hypothetical protein
MYFNVKQNIKFFYIIYIFSGCNDRRIPQLDDFLETPCYTLRKEVI